MGRAAERPVTRLVASAVLVLIAAAFSACGGEPAQIIDYAPQRGAVDVSTATPVKITFDHDVDRASVESRLHLMPATNGLVHWANGHQLVYQHATLRTSTSYEVILEAGYKDVAGNAYSLRHHWSFVTETAPTFTGSTPANGDTGVDPAAYLVLSFSRQMDAAALASAITLTPAAPFEVRGDASDSRRAIVAPSQLLDPNTTYNLSISTGAADIDGNQINRFLTFAFKTGPPRPLHGWITFTTIGVDGSPGGLWIVNESGFPRLLFNSTPVHSFSWSPDGASLLIQGDGETWWQLSPGTEGAQLGFKGPWAAALAAGMGYVYIDDAGVLHRVSADGADTQVAMNVSEASVSAAGQRVLFISGQASHSIQGYDVGLRATFLLASDSRTVTNAVWAPSGNRIAYLRHDSSGVTVRIRNLVGNGATSTALTGDIQGISWLSDSTHMVVGATLPAPQGQMQKAFVINALLPPPTLTAASALPADPAVDVSSPSPSPDGHQIAFLNGDQVWLMNADGTRPTALTKLDPESFPYSCQALAWTRS